jgi:MmyB-like transcription regulator ligand binding domain
MDRKQFGGLIAALRKEQFDENGDRYTQANLAAFVVELDPQTPLNEIIIGKIERGERTILDDHTLLNLADAVKLTIGERRVFFLLATGLDHQQIYPDEGSSEKFLSDTMTMLGEIHLPAILLDRYLDVIAVNGSLLQLYQMSQIDVSQYVGQAGIVNLLDFIFSESFAGVREQMPPKVWHRFAVGNVIYFRRVTLPYRMTDYFQGLYAHLRKNREFRWFWEQVFYEEKLYFVGGESFQMGSASAGRFRFLTTPLVTHTPYGNLEILTHIPLDEGTAAAFHEMSAQTSAQAYQLSPWPDKAWD